ncbi:hypothetical protein V7S43_015158 [Phytophthora oleae]|uniref:Uncharacterized protein n=1 Tax=Phytophthora oleae TaxID=2107226 RepID=A0ABD3F000_9STRA
MEKRHPMRGYTRLPVHPVAITSLNECLTEFGRERLSTKAAAFQNQVQILAGTHPGKAFVTRAARRVGLGLNKLGLNVISDVDTLQQCHHKALDRHLSRMLVTQLTISRLEIRIRGGIGRHFYIAKKRVFFWNGKQ